jgi:hypothetical protein
MMTILRDVNLPSRRSALKALHKGAEVWVSLTVVKKPYFCKACSGAIGVGEEVVVARYKDRRPGGSDHHFIHPCCFRERLLPLLRQVQQLPPGEAGQVAVNKRLRRRRGNASRRARGRRR